VLVLLVRLLEDEGAGFEVELVFLSDEVVLVVFGVDDAFLVDELDSLDDGVEVVEGVECEVLLDEEVVLLLVVGANPKVYTST
jgi:hypothetical protein